VCRTRAARCCLELCRVRAYLVGDAVDFFLQTEPSILGLVQQALGPLQLVLTLGPLRLQSLEFLVKPHRHLLRHLEVLLQHADTTLVVGTLEARLEMAHLITNRAKRLYTG